MLDPQISKSWTGLTKLLHQFSEPRISGAYSGAGSKFGHNSFAFALPIYQQLFDARVSKDIPDNIALSWWSLSKITEYRAGRPVPGQNIPAPAGNIGRAGFVIIQYSLQARTDRFLSMITILR